MVKNKKDVLLEEEITDTEIKASVLRYLIEYCPSLTNKEFKYYSNLNVEDINEEVSDRITAEYLDRRCC
jgi:hypothetical protein